MPTRITKDIVKERLTEIEKDVLAKNKIKRERARQYSNAYRDKIRQRAKNKQDNSQMGDDSASESNPLKTGRS